jgi:putative transposase
MGIEAVYPKPKLSQPGEGHRIYPYLLRGVGVDCVNQVWSTDITVIRMAQGFVYLGIAKGCALEIPRRRSRKAESVGG